MPRTSRSRSRGRSLTRSVRKRKRSVTSSSSRSSSSRDLFTPRRRTRPISSSGSSIPRVPRPVVAGGFSSRVASVKKSGKRVTFKRKPPVRVSSVLRKKIKKVMDGQEYHGKYIATYYGYIAQSSFTSAATQIGGVTDYAVLGTPGLGNIAYFSVPFSSGDNVTAGKDFVFFSPARVMDAASCLFDRKPAVQDYTIRTGNFTSSVTPGTGVPSANFAGGVKINVKNSWVDFEITNSSSQRCKNITLNICSSKLRIVNQGPLWTFKQGYDTDVLNNLYSGDSINQHGLHPSMFSIFNNAFNVEKISFCVEAGQTVKYRLQGPKDELYDFKKFSGPGDQDGYDYAKKTRFMFISYENDLLITDNRKVGTPYPTGSFPGPVAIRYTCGYNISCPSNAGFIDQNAAANTPQQLNLRKPMLIVQNYVESYDPATEVYHRIDEENPVTPITSPA